MTPSDLEKLRVQATLARDNAAQVRAAAEQAQANAAEAQARALDLLAQLRRERDRAGAGEREGELGEDREVGVEPNPI
jgi:hypothetical protein